jgi:signal transduction histidine kinase
MQYDSVMLTPARLISRIWRLALLTVHLGLRPLRQLSRDLAQRQPDDLSPVDLPQVDRELAPVVQALNQTLTRLRSLLEHERNALADLAHELRTPLAVMTHQVDTLRHAGSESERSAAAQRLEGVLQRTTHLVHQMLALGRLDATTDMGWTEVRVPDLVRETLATHAPMAARRHMSLAYAGPDQMTCSAPGASLYLIVDNLVRNAISHGRDGMQVEVRLTPRANRAELPALGPDLCELSVLDNGPGVPAAQWPRLFERFYRLAPASTQGSGLGLAIVAAAAAQLGGHVHAHTGLHGQGLGVSVSWPMRP